jgi:hypothetical protein
MVTMATMATTPTMLITLTTKLHSNRACNRLLFVLKFYLFNVGYVGFGSV